MKETISFHRNKIFSLLSSIPKMNKNKKKTLLIEKSKESANVSGNRNTINIFNITFKMFFLFTFLFLTGCEFQGCGHTFAPSVCPKKVYEQMEKEQIKKPISVKISGSQIYPDKVDFVGQETRTDESGDQIFLEIWKDGNGNYYYSDMTEYYNQYGKRFAPRSEMKELTEPLFPITDEKK